MELEELVTLFIERGGVITVWPCAKEDHLISFAVKLDGVESRGVADSLNDILREKLALDDDLDDFGDNDWAKPDSMF